VHAAARLSEAGFGGTANRTSNFLFFAKVAALMALHKAMPFAFEQPALLRINDPKWGYDDIEKACAGESATLAAVAGAVLALTLGTCLFGWEALARGTWGAVKAVVMGEEGSKGLAIIVLAALAAVTAVFRYFGKRRRRRRRGNMASGGAMPGLPAPGSVMPAVAMVGLPSTADWHGVYGDGGGGGCGHG